MADTRSVVFMVPGSIDTRTGGSIYDRRMAQGRRQRGWAVDVVELDATFPAPTGRALERAGQVFDSMRDGSLVIVDGLALSAMPDQVQRARSRLSIVALIHLPLVESLYSAGPTAVAQPANGTVERGERQALAASSMVVVTGAATVQMLSRYDLPPGRVVIVEPGTDHQPLARGSDGAPIRLLSVGTLNPLKGHVLLLQPWHLAAPG